MKNKNPLIIVLLFAAAAVNTGLLSCSKTIKGPNYVITYTGSLKTDSTIIFSCNVPKGTQLLWNFDDKSTYPSYYDSAWVYRHGGTYTVSVQMMGDTVHVASKTISISWSQNAPSATPPQGNIRFHHYYELDGAFSLPIIERTDTTIPINNIDAYTVSFNNENLYYTSESDSIANYQEYIFPDFRYSLAFNKHTHSILLTDYIHISAAASQIDSFSSY